MQRNSSPNYSSEDKALAYAILGGIPRYLEEFDPDETIDANVKRHILRRIAPLYSEVEFLLHKELRETAKYNSGDTGDRARRNFAE